MSTHITNKGLYFSMIVFGMLTIGGLAYAFNTNAPAVMGHSPGELDWTQWLVGNPRVFGKLSISRDQAGECCTNGDFTLSLAENSIVTGKKSTIQFHNAGQTEGAIKLDAGINGREFKVTSVQDNMDLHATGYVQGDQGLCIGTDCKTAWSQVMGSLSSYSSSAFNTVGWSNPTETAIWNVPFSLPAGTYLVLMSAIVGGTNVGNYRLKIDNVDYHYARIRYGVEEAAPNQLYTAFAMPTLSAGSHTFTLTAASEASGWTAYAFNRWVYVIKIG